MLLLIFVTVQKKARGLYHSNECAWMASHPGEPLALQRATGARADACATGKNERAGKPSIPIGDGGYLGHRPFGSQGKQECLCY